MDGSRSLQDGRPERQWPVPFAPANAGQVTRDLNADGGPRLHDALYRQLRGLARRELRRIGHRRTLTPTALVNEAWLKLVQGAGGAWDDRAHFLAGMARVMRHVLIDYAREQGAQRRGGGALRVTLEGALTPDAAHGEAIELLAIDRALQALSALDARLERIVEMRFFAGLTAPEIAGALNVSEATVKRELRLARAFIAAEIGYVQ